MRLQADDWPSCPPGMIDPQIPVIIPMNKFGAKGLDRGIGSRFNCGALKITFF